MTVPTLRRACVLVVSALIALPALAACGDSERAAAASVGSNTISVSELQGQVRDVEDAFGDDAIPDGAEFQRQLLTGDVRGFLLADLADREGVEVSGSEIDQVVDSGIESAGTREALLEGGLYTEETLRQAAHDQILADRLSAELGGSEQLVTAAQELGDELGVNVSRRYGTWDRAALAVVASPGAIASTQFAPAE